MNPMINVVNVFNKPLIVCGTNPMTGVYRDGCCNTGSNDRGTHTVCAVVTDAFLQYSKKQPFFGNYISANNQKKNDKFFLSRNIAILVSILL